MGGSWMIPSVTSLTERSVKRLLSVVYVISIIFPVYVDMGTLASDTATLSFAFQGESTLRAWEVKVSQIPCAASYA